MLSILDYKYLTNKQFLYNYRYFWSKVLCIHVCVVGVRAHACLCAISIYEMHFKSGPASYCYSLMLFWLSFSSVRNVDYVPPPCKSHVRNITVSIIIFSGLSGYTLSYPKDNLIIATVIFIYRATVITAV